MSALEESEEWLPVVGYEGYYEVSSLGRVRSVTRLLHTVRYDRWYPGRLLVSMLHPDSGHEMVGLSRDNVTKTKKVHSLVATAFLGPRPDGLECCHGDGDPTNNRVSNLRWDTRSENLLDTVRHGVNFWAKRTHCKNGHEFTPENTVMRRRDGSGGRVCIKCRRERGRAGQARRARERKRMVQ